MRNGILASIAVILIGGSPALAQQLQSPATPQQSTTGPQSTGVQNTADQGQLPPRLNFLRENLQLTVDQQRHWNAYAAAVQNLAKVRRHLRQLAQQRTEVTDPNQAIRQQAQAVGDLSAALSGLASAQEPLYDSLNQSQKQQFTENAPALRMIRPGTEVREFRSGDRDDNRVGRWRDREPDERWSGRDEDRSSWRRGRDRYEDRVGRWRDWERDEGWSNRDESQSSRWRGRDRYNDRVDRWDDWERDEGRSRRDESQSLRWRGRDRDEDDYHHRRRRYDDRNCDRRPWQCDRDYEMRDRGERGYYRQRRHQNEDD